MSEIHNIARAWQDHHLSPTWSQIQAAVLEYDAEREESKRWMAKAHSERDARMAVEACTPYLKEGETPAERIQRERADSAALLGLYQSVLADCVALRAELERIRAPLSDEQAADPCPGCAVGHVCRTPKCGRLKLPKDHPLRTGLKDQS